MRTQLNVMDKVILPRKGSAVDVVSGLKDRKGGELLLSLAYNARVKEKIGTLPVLPAITRPVQIVEPPNVVRIQPFYHNNAIEDSVDEDWCIKAWQVLSFSSKITLADVQQRFSGGDLSFNSQVRYTAIRLLHRLPMFLKNRIPKKRSDLMPGCHWVWDSLRDKIFKLAALMILSKHILDGEALVFRGNTECLLTSKDNFVMADTDDQWKNQQGAYVACDPCRGVFIRSGTAEVGLVKRWREHINASKRSTPGDKNSVLYSSYCHPNTAEVNKPPFKSRKGNFL